MEIELTRISSDADVYDVRKAVAAVLHGPEFFDPNDKENKGRLPNFEIIMGKSPAGRIHNREDHSPCWLKPGTPITTYLYGRIPYTVRCSP